MTTGDLTAHRPNRGQTEDMTDRLANAVFVRDLRHALQHLYDASELRKSPLLAPLGVARRDDPAVALRRLLLQAIAALKPAPDVPAQSATWRTYQVLSLRYAEQYSQREVGVDLSLSIRQVRREDSRAVRALADYLWLTHNLQSHPPAPPLPAAADAVEVEDADGGTPSREREMEWLCRSLPSETVEVDGLMQGVLHTVSPLAQESAVRVQCAVPAGLPRLTVQQAAIRQALLNTAVAAIHCAPGGCVSLQASSGRGFVTINVRPSPHLGGPLSLSTQDRERLDMAAQLVRLAGGDFACSEGASSTFAVELKLPAAEQVAVLVIDDNADTLELMQRYLAGTRYRFLPTSDPGQVLAAPDAPVPDIIVLDVMLPGIDGWEMVERLREHPRTRNVPIIVCSILPQEELALALGAAAFLHKPVTRRSLLAALDRLLAPPATGCG